MDCQLHIIGAPSQPPTAPPNSPLPLYDVTRTGFGEPFQLPETAEYHSYISAAVYNIAMAGPVCGVQQASSLSRSGHHVDTIDMREYMDGPKRVVPAGQMKVMYAKVYPASFGSAQKLQKTNTELQRIASIFCVEPDKRCTCKQDVNVLSTTDNAVKASILDAYSAVKPKRAAIDIADMRECMDATRRDIPAGLKKIKHAKVYPARFNSDEKLQKTDTHLKHIASLFCVDLGTRRQHVKEVFCSNNNALQANIIDGDKPQVNSFSRFISRLHTSFKKATSFRKSRKVWPCNSESDQSGSVSTTSTEKITSLFCVETRDDADTRKKRTNKETHNNSGRTNHVSAFV